MVRSTPPWTLVFPRDKLTSPTHRRGDPGMNLHITGEANRPRDRAGGVIAPWVDSGPGGLQIKVWTWHMGPQERMRSSGCWKKQHNLPRL